MTTVERAEGRDSEISQLIATNVRRFRQERGLSLGDMARRSGLSKQTLSKLEAGAGNPTVDTLAAVGVCLGVPLRRLVTEWGNPVYVRRAESAGWRQHYGSDIRFLDEIFGTGHVRTQVVRLSKKMRTATVMPHSSGTLHHVYVIEGEIRTGPLSDPVDLGPGDFVRFPGDVPHRHVCLSATALAHMVTTVPQIRQFSTSEPG
ncbi:helix-turn-helix domain-containing protein [Janibacter sp. YIM B02568]|uniref:helix-turn-helix domain-containing protein n=1 Tax=Janibacter endophyticus TaxID=2806261 RepID=UPI0019521B1B|nr:helix-turn-helix domain-containing protein [Janibacter endophyticus]MBM6545373.1 helix-turn-helix domain-containing protein [Janibacter endophyticus]